MKPPYDITPRVLSLYGRITEALGVCKSLLLVKPEARLRKENRIKTIYGSLAIEGNTLGISHVTAIINDARVVGPGRDILEVRNAIRAYERINSFKPFSLRDFLRAHKVLTQDLVGNAGSFRTKQVGIFKGKRVSHIAPGYKMVPGLMRDLFDYLKNDKDLPIIKSCVFHYETEFIHPFEDGNGRMGRFWQTRLLMNVNPIFEYVPVEEAIKNNQKKYYKVLETADLSGSSTAFLEFMLEAIDGALRKTIDESKARNIDYTARSAYALSELSGWFDRKEYMKLNKEISTATASRDLKQLAEAGVLETAGSGRLTKYRKR
jgi:Fic family protein